MDNLELRNYTFNDVLSRISIIEETRIESLTRELELGEPLSFLGIKSYFEKVFNILLRLKLVLSADMPVTSLQTLITLLGEIQRMFTKIKEFSIMSSNPLDERTSIISEFLVIYDQFLAHSLHLLSMRFVQDNELSEQRNEFQKILTNLELEVDRTKKTSLEYLSEIQGLLSNAKQASLEIGISNYQSIFLEESEYHKSESRKWIIGIFVLLVVIIILGISFLFLPILNTQTHFLIQFTMTKIIVISVLFYSLSICTRNFKAHKHNSVLNKHRQNALRTFEVFTKAAGSDVQTKNAVLLEVTRTIFSTQQTGYLMSESESENPNRIVEIIKSSASEK